LRDGAFGNGADDDELNVDLDAQRILAFWADCFESHLVRECR
jgi:hypothetical protein